MPLISHRGAAGLFTANSREAITEAQKYCPDYIEVDINCTSDGKLIVYHGSLVRFLRGKKTKETFEEIQSTHPELMTLDEFIAAKPKESFIFDIKVTDDGSLQSIYEALRKLRLHKIAFTSPHEKALVFMKREFDFAQIFQSQPYHHGPVTAVEIARKHKFEGVSLNKWWMTPFVHRLCKVHGKKLMCYTVDSRLGIWLIVKFFPDVYVVTNRPDIYRQLFPIDNK